MISTTLSLISYIEPSFHLLIRLDCEVLLVPNYRASSELSPLMKSNGVGFVFV
jgi:hypothetical protein